MAYVGLLLVLAAYCVVLFFVSLLASGGDGGSGGVKAVWLFGYTWIALFGLGGFVLCIRRKVAAGISLAASALPAGWAAALVVVAVGNALGFHLG